MAFLIPLIIGLATSGATTAGTIAIASKKNSNALKVASTVKADEAESLLKKNVAEWNATPNQDRTVELQQLFIESFYNVWYAFVDSMGQLGERGQIAVNERTRGGHNSWGPDWFMLYLDPIANTHVVDQITGNEIKTTINPSTNVITASVTGNTVATNSGVPTDTVDLSNMDLTSLLGNPLVLAGIAFIGYSMFKKGK